MYCLPCAGAAAGAGQNDAAAKTGHPSDDIEPAALENESLGEERSDNIEPACELTNAMTLNIFTFPATY